MGMPLDDLLKTVRIFMNDFPHLNELRGVAEMSPAELALAATMALDDYNTTPPLLQPVTFANHPSDSLMIIGTVCYCLLQKGILQFRNQLAYNDGGVNVGLWDKGPAYMGNAQFFAQLWESKKVSLKRSINVNLGWGCIRSAEFNIYTLMQYYGGEYTSPVGEPPKDPSVGAMVEKPGPTTGPKTKTDTIAFILREWNDSFQDTTKYEIAFFHNLNNRNVAVILDDPKTGEDLSQRISIVRASDRHIVLRVPKTPDGRCEGTVQCYIP